MEPQPLAALAQPAFDGREIALTQHSAQTLRRIGGPGPQRGRGRSMLVCCLTHEQPHHHAAWEWFDHGQTLALLPMNDDPASGAPQTLWIVF